VNLECVLSDKGEAIAGKRYCLRAPLDAIGVLAAARINAVSLANNHSADFGSAALFDAMERLRGKEIAAIGAGETMERAYAPHFFTTPAGTKAAVIALNDVEENSNAVASMHDRERVAAALTLARKSASFVLVFMHWGDEQTSGVTERQRELARWLIDHGADAIAGSHPHCVQPFDSYRGRPIIYSLGNLVFDGAPTLSSWNRGQLLAFDLGGARPLFHLVDVQLNARGFPQVAPAAQDREKILATAGPALSRNRVQGASKKR
jgi:poly-gamma-glutamate synthesis protein (capsule biosynthesis protein)